MNGVLVDLKRKEKEKDEEEKPNKQPIGMETFLSENEMK